MAEDGSTPFAKLWAHSIHFLSRLIFVLTRVKHELCVVKANYEQPYRLIMNSLLLKFVNLNFFCTEAAAASKCVEIERLTWNKNKSKFRFTNAPRFNNRSLLFLNKKHHFLYISTLRWPNLPSPNTIPTSLVIQFTKYPFLLHLCTSQSTYICIYLPAYLPTYLPVHLSTYLHLHLHTYLSVHLST